MNKHISFSIKTLLVAVAAGVALPASAEMDWGESVSASVGVSNIYLWRGYDVGEGDAAVSGDISLSAGGFYGGVWTSSGDAAAGTEYDLYLGYGGAVGEFQYDFSVVSYVYPTDVSAPAMSDTNIGEWMEGILTLGYGPVSVSYYETLEAEPGTYAFSEDYNYYTVDLALGDFSFLLGRHDHAQGDNPTHLDASYHYSDRLSFTVSKMVADEDAVESDANFVVSYTLPLQ